MQSKAGGLALKALRESRNLTQKEVEKASGVSDKDLSRIEIGAVARPRMDVLVALGATYGLDPNQVAEMYGYWAPKVAGGDPILDRLAHLMDQLPAGDRQRIQGMLELTERAASEAVEKP